MVRFRIADSLAAIFKHSVELLQAHRLYYAVIHAADRQLSACSGNASAVRAITAMFVFRLRIPHVSSWPFISGMLQSVRINQYSFAA
jgi:hypothetical protein